MPEKVLSERSGMRVSLDSGVVTKYARDDANLAGINNAYRFYRALSDTKYVPKNAVLSGNTLQTEYVEERCFLKRSFGGDGPGPEFLKTDDDTRKMLSEYASVVEPLITIPVHDRNAIRTTWLVKR